MAETHTGGGTGQGDQDRGIGQEHAKNECSHRSVLTVSAYESAAGDIATCPAPLHSIVYSLHDFTPLYRVVLRAMYSIATKHYPALCIGQGIWKGVELGI